MEQQIYYIKRHPEVDGISIIRAKGYEESEYLADRDMLKRIREIANVNRENNREAMFVIF